MAAFRIAVIGGDGIGPEVIEQAIRVADAARRHDQAVLEWNRLPWSSSHYQKTGQMMPPDGWDILCRHDAILLGAIGHPEVPDHITLHGLLLPMRRRFDQYVNLRPAYLFDGVQSPLRDKAPGSIDMVVASNLFGDILTDLSAVVTGSMGLAASANINPERTFPSMFEPVHGSAPDIAGKGIANPLAAILSAGLLLDHLGLDKSASALRKAVADVLKAGSPRTPDLGGNAGTVEVADAVLAAVQRV